MDTGPSYRVESVSSHGCRVVRGEERTGRCAKRARSEAAAAGTSSRDEARTSRGDFLNGDEEPAGVVEDEGRTVDLEHPCSADGECKKSRRSVRDSRAKRQTRAKTASEDTNRQS